MTDTHWDDPEPPPLADTDAPDDAGPVLALITEMTAAPITDTHTELAWRRINLGDVLNGNAPSETPNWLTRTDSQSLIYPGRHHDIHGEPEDGKSWIALAACTDAILAGRAIIWIDWEDTEDAFVARLRALGLEDAIIGDPTAIAFIIPEGPFGTLEIDGILELATQLDAAIIVFDAMADALALDGLDENSNTDAVRWLSRVARPFNRQGIASITLDHVSRDPATRTRGARGGGSKLGFIDGASYATRMIKPFSRTTPGQVNLIIAKDRHGRVGPRGTTAARFMITPHNDGAIVDLNILPPDANKDPEGHFLPTHLMERISRHYEDLPDGAQLSKRAILRDVTGKDKHLAMAVDRLLEHGHLTADLSGTNPVYSLTNEYRAPDETTPLSGSEDTTAARGPTAAHRGPGLTEEGAAPDPLSLREGAATSGRGPNPENDPARPDPEPTFDHEDGPW